MSTLCGQIIKITTITLHSHYCAYVHYVLVSMYMCIHSNFVFVMRGVASHSCRATRTVRASCMPDAS